MKIVICWSHISGYMAACWRALAAVPGVSVYLIAFASDSVAPFDAVLLGDVRHRLMNDAERLDAKFVRDLVLAEKPDVLVVSGWSNVAYRPLAADAAFAGATKIMTMDTPLRLDWRQAVGRRLLRPYLRKFDRIAVPGERAAMYAKYLGFAPGQIRRGSYGFDFSNFAGALEHRSAAPWPRSFLYVGRYAPEKALDVMVDGYVRYRAAAGAGAWGLVCCGRGPEQAKLNAPGVTDLGFVPPDRQAEVFAGAGAFVIASRYEPWGVAIVEAAAAGLPLVCSDACGASAELLREGFNGYGFGTGDALMLADRLARVTRADGPLWGARSRAMAEAFSAADWPARIFDGLLPTGT